MWGRILHAYRDASRRRVWVVVFACVAVVYLATATYDTSQITDTANTAVQAYVIADDGSPVVDGLYEAVPDARRQVVPGRSGEVTNRLPGPVFVGTLAYGLATPFTPGRELIDSRLDVPMWPAGVAAALVVAAAVATLAVTAREMKDVSAPVALVGTAVLAFGTATWSVSANALWTHTVTQLGLLLAISGLVRGADARTGIGMAVSVLARTHTALIAAGAGLGRGWDVRRVRPVVVVGVLSAVGLVVAMGYGLWLYGGGPSVSVGYPEYSDRVMAGGVEGRPLDTLGTWALFLVHPTRGLLPTTPFLVPLLFGLGAAWRAAPRWVQGMALGAVAQLLLQGTVNPYDGGDTFFGSRLTIEFLTATVPLWLLAYSVGLRDRPRAREWTHATAVASVVVHAAGATLLSRGVV